MNANIDPRFVQQLQLLWSIEDQLVQAMPLLIEKAQSVGLRKNLALHFEETRQQKVALEAMGRQLNIEVGKGDPHRELEALLAQSADRIRQAPAVEVDALILEGALQVEALEMDAYVPAAETARALGLDGVASRLFLSFEEERQAASKLRFLEKAQYSERANIGYGEEAAAPFGSA